MSFGTHIIFTPFRSLCAFSRIRFHKSFRNAVCILPENASTLPPRYKSSAFVVSGKQSLQRNALIHKVWLGDNHWTVVFPIEGQISSNHKSVSSTYGASICRIAILYRWIGRNSLKSSRDSHCYCCLNWSNVFEKLGQQAQSLMR